jgi:hypothetical protein
LDTPLKEDGITLATEEPAKTKTATETKKDETNEPLSDAESSSDELDPKQVTRPTTDANIVKKKRPVEEEDAALAASSDNFVSGSFAAWKERKKQKKTVKTDSNEHE